MLTLRFGMRSQSKFHESNLHLRPGHTDEAKDVQRSVSPPSLRLFEIGVTIAKCFYVLQGIWKTAE